MTSKQFARLEEAMGKWISDCVEEDGQVSDWYVGDRLALLMATAARAVFDSSEDGQEYAESQASPTKKSA